jgi:hypothetical protein
MDSLKYWPLVIHDVNVNNEIFLQIDSGLFFSDAQTVLYGFNTDT